MSSPPNPFAPPGSDAAAPRREPLPDVPAADVLEPSPLGPLVEVARTSTVHEAELLRARLVNAGLRVALRDQFAIGTDPLLSHALNGVKVVVAEADAARAREVLAQPARATGPVFRVDQASGLWSGVIGLAGGTVAGLLLAPVLGPAAVAIAGAIGALVGAKAGARVERHCTGCQGELTVEATECPRCGGRIAGVLGHANERLDAEERLRRGGGLHDPGPAD